MIRHKWLFFVFLAGIVWSSCGSSVNPESKPSTPTPTSTPQPDLQPVKGGSPLAYCHLAKQADGSIILTVTIQNQGRAAAGPSKTLIGFTPINHSLTQYAQTLIATETIPIGQSVDITGKFPFSPEDYFTPQGKIDIKADVEQAVIESNEANNNVHEACG